MLTKDKRRGERRWRSHSVWMRRLKVDWAEHGWQYNMRPQFDYGGPDPKKVIGWVSDLCRCFDLKNKEAIRFKDTPTGNESRAAFRRNDGYHDQRLWEERNAVLEEDVRQITSKKRRHRPGTHPYRLCCRMCGFLIEIVQVNNGEWFRGAYLARCEGCKKKEDERKAAAAMKLPA